MDELSLPSNLVVATFACYPSHSSSMLSQSLSGAPHRISAQNVSRLPSLPPSVAARPVRRRALYLASAEPSSGEQRVRIKLKAYELPLLQQSIAVIQDAAKRTGIEQVSGFSAFCAHLTLQQCQTCTCRSQCLWACTIANACKEVHSIALSTCQQRLP